MAGIPEEASSGPHVERLPRNTASQSETLIEVTESKTPTYDPMIFAKNRGSKKNGWYPVREGDDVGEYGTY